MIDEKARANAYAAMYAALHSLRANVITFADFMDIVRGIRKDLEEGQQKLAS